MQAESVGNKSTSMGGYASHLNIEFDNHHIVPSRHGAVKNRMVDFIKQIVDLELGRKLHPFLS